MGQIIRVKRGLKANIGNAGLLSGEMAFCTDTKELFINDGTNNNLVGKYLINDSLSTTDNVYSASHVDTLVGAFAEGVLYKGAWDATTDGLAGLAGAEIGNMYIVRGATATIGGVDYEDGDKVIFNKTASDPVVATDFDLYKGAANIDSSDISDWDAAVEARIVELLVDTNTIDAVYDDVNNQVKFNLRYEDSTSINLSDSATGLKAEAIVDNATIKIDETSGLYVYEVDGGEFTA